MGEYNFNTRQCIKALKKLGFILKNQRLGIHDKYMFPDKYIIPEGQRPFIMIPRHSELRLQHQIMRELKVVGGDKLVQDFTSLL